MSEWTQEGITENQPYRDSGKDKSLVSPPIVSMHKTSHDKSDDVQSEKKIEVIDVSEDLFDTEVKSVKDGYYPFAALKIGQGFFIPVKEGQTVDKLVHNMHRAACGARDDYAIEVKNEEGERILDSVAIETLKRNEDGTFQLEPDGKPTVGANATHIPRCIYPRDFLVKAVVKNDEIGKNSKASSDGVVIVRVV